MEPLWSLQVEKAGHRERAAGLERAPRCVHRNQRGGKEVGSMPREDMSAVSGVQDELDAAVAITERTTLADLTEIESP
jgi:hypothetical protein